MIKLRLLTSSTIPRVRPAVCSAIGTLLTAALISNAALLSNTAIAQEATMQVTSTTTLEMRIDNDNGVKGDDDYGVIQERLAVNANAGDVSSWARIDSDFFLNKPSAAFEQNLRVERLGVSWEIAGFTLQAGDFFQQLGRGFTLNLRKLTGAGVDVSLRGAKASYLGEVTSFSVFAGQPNAANIDPVNQRYLEDSQDILGGATFELTPIASTRIGFYGLGNLPGERLLDEEIDFSVTTGSYLDLPALFPFLAAYAEGIVQYRQLAGQPQVGAAAYLNAEARFGDFGLLYESMYLSQFEQKGSTNSALGSRFDYNQPPTLERIDQEVVNNRDLIGSRIRAEYYFTAIQLLLYLNTMARLNFPGKNNEFIQLHAFGGVEWTFPGGTGRLNVAGGVRDESETLLDAASTFSFLDDTRTPIKSMVHLDIDWFQPLPLFGLSIHTVTNTQFWVFQGQRYDRGSTFLGVEKAGVGGLTFEFGYDTLNQSTKIQNFFYALIGAWEAEDWLTFRGTLGTQRGGIKCVAGVCREFPAFAGARVQMVTRF